MSDHGHTRRTIQSRGEEIANSVSHGLGFFASMAAAPVLIFAAVQRGGAAEIVGVSVFAATLMLMYMTSTVYHALSHDTAKRVFRVIDHCAIFLLIAGTYTPFTLGVLKGAWGWTLFGIVWGLALFGIALKTIRGTKHPRLSMFLYVAMGWLIVIAAKPLWLNMPPAGFYWLIAGGLAYTAGIGFYANRNLKYAHFIWHLFVMAGTACHFIAVLNYAI